jgi:predicted phosphodiesterase
MKLLAISDLHVGYEENRAAVEASPAHPGDWLVVAGDVGETEDQLEWALATLASRWAQVIWVPGNHELWTMDRRGSPARGVARYEGMVEVCRELGVLTPEDPFPIWPGEGPPTVIAPCFLLYDYSWAPDGYGPDAAVAWARDAGLVCVDEARLHPEPYPSREAWCRARVALTARRLAEVPSGHRIVLVNHWPLRRDLVRLFRIPRFTIWCGTRATEDWHVRFPIDVVVHGHLHMRSTDWRDGVRFEEVAIGYPRHWDVERGLASYLRQILPRVGRPPPGGHGGPDWHR